MANHSDSIHLSASEYQSLFDSKWLSKQRGFKIEKVGEFFKITADWPESLWSQLEERLYQMNEEE